MGDVGLEEAVVVGETVVLNLVEEGRMTALALKTTGVGLVAIGESTIFVVAIVKVMQAICVVGARLGLMDVHVVRHAVLGLLNECLAVDTV